MQSGSTLFSRKRGCFSYMGGLGKTSRSKDGETVYLPKEQRGWEVSELRGEMKKRRRKRDS